MGLGAGTAHVSADALSGSITSGHAVYAGHARLWQGDSVLDADRIELWRDDKRLLATGHVVAVFPQQGGPLDKSLASWAEPGCRQKPRRRKLRQRSGGRASTNGTNGGNGPRSGRS